MKELNQFERINFFVYYITKNITYRDSSFKRFIGNLKLIFAANDPKTHYFTIRNDIDNWNNDFEKIMGYYNSKMNLKANAKIDEFFNDTMKYSREFEPIIEKYNKIMEFNYSKKYAIISKVLEYGIKPSSWEYFSIYLKYEKFSKMTNEKFNLYLMFSENQFSLIDDMMLTIRDIICGKHYYLFNKVDVDNIQKIVDNFYDVSYENVELKLAKPISYNPIKNLYLACLSDYKSLNSKNKFIYGDKYVEKSFCDTCITMDDIDLHISSLIYLRMSFNILINDDKNIKITKDILNNQLNNEQYNYYQQLQFDSIKLYNKLTILSEQQIQDLFNKLVSGKLLKFKSIIHKMMIYQDLKNNSHENKIRVLHSLLIGTYSLLVSDKSKKDAIEIVLSL